MPKSLYSLSFKWVFELSLSLSLALPPSLSLYRHPEGSAKAEGERGAKPDDSTLLDGWDPLLVAPNGPTVNREFI